MRLDPDDQRADMTVKYTPYVTRRQRREYREKKTRAIIITVIALVILIIVAVAMVGVLRKKFRLLSQYSLNGSMSIADENPESIPDYNGKDFVILNKGIPSFNAWDLKNIKGEHYSDLDELDRCGVAYAMLDRSMMPTEKRGEIGQIKPSGWNQAKYEGIVDSEPPYLYNRCHLIAYALTGQNANELNLITGTRYMNATSMLPFEEQVMSSLDDSDNHVLYRVTPYFVGNELVARGVEMEAYSVEDKGDGLCFHVFIYNIQPGIDIDYKTGESKVSK